MSRITFVVVIAATVFALSACENDPIPLNATKPLDVSAPHPPHTMTHVYP